MRLPELIRKTRDRLPLTEKEIRSMRFDPLDGALPEAQPRARLIAIALRGRILTARGGDRAVADYPGLLPQALIRQCAAAPVAGLVAPIGAETVVHTPVRLVDARSRPEDSSDAAPSFPLRAKAGDPVRSGDPLAEVHG